MAAGVEIGPVSKVTAWHTMHTYYLLNPESPDGRRILFSASTQPAGHVGQISVLDRQTGIETVLADEFHTEDGRVALSVVYKLSNTRVSRATHVLKQRDVVHPA